MIAVETNIRGMGKAARIAAGDLARCAPEQRDKALRTLAELLVQNSQSVLSANEQDLAAGAADGIDEHVAERMTLNDARIGDMVDAVVSIADLEDPVGEVLEETEASNGLLIQRVRVPLGVIGVIYESRPNITIDIAALCLKAGNAVILRGGKEAIRTNQALASLVRDAVIEAEMPADAVQFVESTDRALVGEMLEMDDCIDMLIPRGSAELVHMVAEKRQDAGRYGRHRRLPHVRRRFRRYPKGCGGCVQRESATAHRLQRFGHFVGARNCGGAGFRRTVGSVRRGWCRGPRR